MNDRSFTKTAASHDENRVLSDAVVAIADYWQLTHEQLAAVLGVSTASGSRLRAGRYRLERGTKPFELGQYLVRLFRGLDSIMGSDDVAAQSWLRTVNLDLEARPVDLIGSIKGLTRTCDYVDAFRARV